MTAAGTQASMILLHSGTAWGFRRRPPANGQSLSKYSTTTAIIDPSWITTKNIFQNSGVMSNDTNSFNKIICPVELTGSHSVMPSTMPNNAAFNISNIT